MKRTLLVFTMAFALVGLVLSGCKKDDLGPSTVTEEEIAAMKQDAANDDFVKNDDELMADTEVMPMDYGNFGKVDAAITPLRWGRFVQTITRNVSVTILPGDSIAVARVEKTFVGTLRILGLSGTDTLNISKPFTDLSTRNVIFKRVRRDRQNARLNWLPVATSLVDGNTVATAPAVDITLLKMYLPSGDSVVVSDPNAFWLRYRWTYLFNRGQGEVPELTPNSRVRLQVTVNSTKSDTDMVALRYGIGLLFHRRARMQCISEVNNGNGTWTRVFEIPFLVHTHRGFFHAGVDAVTKETLFDDVAPYSVSWWGVPYRVL